LSAVIDWLAATPTAVAEVTPFFAAAVTYVVFLTVSCIARIGRGTAPMVGLAKLHLRMSPLYLALSLLFAFLCRRPLDLSWIADLLLGAFFYFGVHFAIVANFFALAYGSVSAAIVSIIYHHGGRATRQDLVTDYAGGRGFDHVKKSRLERLDSFVGWVRRSPGPGVSYELTASGRWAIKTTRLFLGLWGLEQLGAGRD